MENFSNFKLLSFDCYGTLIDWERGIVDGIKPFLQSHHKEIESELLLELFAKYESEIERKNYIEYKKVLIDVFKRICESISIGLAKGEEVVLLDSFTKWEPFPDTIWALKSLKKRFKLAIISNVDDDLFTLTQKKLDVEFDYVITAQQAKAYKPSYQIFNYALDRFGLPKEQILHIAQSIYHDIKPAKELGLKTVWVNRRKGKKGSGATPLETAAPDLEVPDLQTFVELVEKSGLPED